MKVIVKLKDVWEKCGTRQMAKIFEEYMASIGVKKYDPRRNNNHGTCLIDGKSTNWNRVQCHYYKDSTMYCEEDLLLVLRKKAGDYFIIQRGEVRAFECDHRGVINYDESLLNEIVKDHKPLFDTLLSIAG
jgi:hypothetical protein